jgi:hypothetical protein
MQYIRAYTLGDYLMQVADTKWLESKRIDVFFRRQGLEKDNFLCPVCSSTVSEFLGLSIHGEETHTYITKHLRVRHQDKQTLNELPKIKVDECALALFFRCKNKHEYVVMFETHGEATSMHTINLNYADNFKSEVPLSRVTQGRRRKNVG